MVSIKLDSERYEVIEDKLLETSNNSGNKIEKINMADIDKLNDVEDIIKYMINMEPKFTSMRIYLNITDDSEITDLFIIHNNENCRYVVVFKDESYLIKCNDPKLELSLLQNTHTPNIVYNRHKIKCG